MYLLTEQIYNGTVTMSIISTGVLADTWEEAKEKVKNMQNMSRATIIEDTDVVISYRIEQRFPCYGRMENKALAVI